MNIMPKFIFWVALLVGASAAAGVPVESTLPDLPAPAHYRLLKLFGNQQPAISVEHFNSGDVVRAGKSSRLIVLVARDENLYLVHYVHGGRGIHNHLVGIHYDGNAASPVFNVLLDRYQSIAEIQEALSRFAFRTASEY